MQLILGEIIDPRGSKSKPNISLATRKSPGELKKGKILFFDNAKLQFCNFPIIRDSIIDELRKRGINNIVYVKQTLRGEEPSDLKDLAKRLSGEGFAGAIVALADKGVSPASVILTIELEKHGIPSVCITAPPGNKVSQAVAYLRAGKLCLCSLDIHQGSTEDEVSEETRKNIDYIINSLTFKQHQINQYASIDIDLDNDIMKESISIGKIGENLLTADIEPGLGMEEVSDLFERLHITDGLPVIPPTLKRLEKMLEYWPGDPKEVIITSLGPSGRDITIEDIAIGSIMAGCKPEYMPILVTAFKALGNKKYNLLQAITTSHSSGNLIVVSGPIAQEIGVTGGPGCLGPGFRANATIGRAVNLTFISKCRVVPGISDMGCLGSPAEFTYCFAEEAKNNLWPKINEEKYDNKTTTVLVLKAEAPRNVIEFLTGDAEQLLESFIDSATSLGSNNAYLTSTLVFVLTPDHLNILVKNGWDKSKLRKYFHERITCDKDKVQGRGIIPIRPNNFHELKNIPVTRNPDDIVIIGAGGEGGHSAVILPWGMHSEAVIEPVTLPWGSYAKSIKEFKNIK